MFVNLFRSDMTTLFKSETAHNLLLENSTRHRLSDKINNRPETTNVAHYGRGELRRRKFQQINKFLLHDFPLLFVKRPRKSSVRAESQEESRHSKGEEINIREKFDFSHWTRNGCNKKVIL